MEGRQDPHEKSEYSLPAHMENWKPKKRNKTTLSDFID
jgi:hypothetical protein